MFPAVWGQHHPALLLLLRHQRHSFLHLQRAQNRPAELACLLSQRLCLEALHHLLVRQLRYHFQPRQLMCQFQLLRHLFLEVLHHLLVLQLGYRFQLRQPMCQFQLLRHLFLEVLHHLLVLQLGYLFQLRPLKYPFQPLLHLYLEALRHRLALLRPLCHYFLRP